MNLNHLSRGTVESVHCFLIWRFGWVAIQILRRRAMGLLWPCERSIWIYGIIGIGSDNCGSILDYVSKFIWGQSLQGTVSEWVDIQDPPWSYPKHVFWIFETAPQRKANNILDVEVHLKESKQPGSPVTSPGIHMASQKIGSNKFVGRCGWWVLPGLDVELKGSGQATSWGKHQTILERILVTKSVMKTVPGRIFAKVLPKKEVQEGSGD
jgi:hypothetical protein